MELKYGIDLVLSNNESKFSLDFRIFPVSSVNNFPYRNQTIKNGQQNFNNSEEVISFLSDIKKNLNGKLDFFILKNSSEHELLKLGDFNDNLCFVGQQQKEKNENTFLNTHKRYKPVKMPIEDKNGFFIDLNINNERSFKTNEFVAKGYSSYNNMLSKKSLFENSIIFQHSYTSSHDNFIDFILPHILKIQEDFDNIYICTKSNNFPYISSLNRKLTSLGHKTVKQKFKTLNNSADAKSQKRIEQYMKDIYEDLGNLNDKYVIYCDGAVLNNGSLLSGAFIFRENGKKDIERNHLQRCSSKQSDKAELIALQQSIKYIVDNNKNDKPIHFVFDSDYIFKHLNAVLGNDDFEFTRYKKEFEELKDIIKLNNLNIKTLVLKSHQTTDLNSFSKEVVNYNKKVDELTKKRGSYFKKNKF